jgi:hypothetical protein
MLVDTFIRSCPTLSLLRPHYFWHAIANAAHTLQANVLVALAPDVILANGGAAVKTLARLGSNATGFMQFEYRLTGKCLEMLKEVAPGGPARQ